MTDAISDLMHASLFDVFGERDPQRAAQAAERTYHEQVTFADPGGVVTGRAAIVAKAQHLLQGSDALRYAADGPVFVGHGIGCLEWSFGAEGQVPVVRGFDIAVVEDGRITRLQAFLREPAR